IDRGAECPPEVRCATTGRESSRSAVFSTTLQSGCWMSDAIAAYHDLLASGSALAADSQAALEKAQQLRGLVFGSRPVCNVLRPRFLSPAQYKLLHDTVKTLLPAFQAIYDRAVADREFRQQFRLCDWED